MVNKVTRIAYNSGGWRYPTGDASELEDKNTHNHKNGFGFEDWLFRDEWEIGGWRYAFLQGVNKSHAKLMREKLPFNVTLFTVLPDKKRRYVARISEIECISGKQATEALKVFKANGWLDLMRQGIKRVDGDCYSFDHPAYPTDILNIRYKRGNVSFFSENTFATPKDPILSWNRYVLSDEKDGVRRLGVCTRNGSETEPSENTYERGGSNSQIICPEHALMQAKLMQLLKTKFPEYSVIREKNYIDVQVETKSDRWLFEIKTDLSPRTVLRQAIGQLLEYEYFQTTHDGKNLHLVAVGRNKISEEDFCYLKGLQERFNIPLEYWVIKID